MKLFLVMLGVMSEFRIARKFPVVKQRAKPISQTGAARDCVARHFEIVAMVTERLKHRTDRRLS